MTRPSRNPAAGSPLVGLSLLLAAIAAAANRDDMPPSGIFGSEGTATAPPPQVSIGLSSSPARFHAGPPSADLASRAEQQLVLRTATRVEYYAGAAQHLEHAGRTGDTAPRRKRSPLAPAGYSAADRPRCRQRNSRQCRPQATPTCGASTTRDRGCWVVRSRSKTSDPRQAHRPMPAARPRPTSSAASRPMPSASTAAEHDLRLFGNIAPAASQRLPDGHLRTPRHVPRLLRRRQRLGLSATGGADPFEGIYGPASAPCRSRHIVPQLHGTHPGCQRLNSALPLSRSPPSSGDLTAVRSRPRPASGQRVTSASPQRHRPATPGQDCLKNVRIRGRLRRYDTDAPFVHQLRTVPTCLTFLHRPPSHDS